MKRWIVVVLAESENLASPLVWSWKAGVENMSAWWEEPEARPCVGLVGLRTISFFRKQEEQNASTLFKWEWNELTTLDVVVEDVTAIVASIARNQHRRKETRMRLCCVGNDWRLRVGGMRRREKQEWKQNSTGNTPCIIMWQRLLANNISCSWTSRARSMEPTSWQRERDVFRRMIHGGG